MVGFIIRLKRGDSRVLFELSLFNFAAIIKLHLSNQLYFHLVIPILHNNMFNCQMVSTAKKQCQIPGGMSHWGLYIIRVNKNA